MLFLRIVDKVFAKFCEKLGVASIRVYEEQRLSKTQERAQKRQEYATQIAKLQAQLSLERSSDKARQLQEAETKLETAETKLTGLQAERNELQQVVTSETETLTELRQAEQEQNGLHADAETELKEHKKALSAHVAQFNATQKVWGLARSRTIQLTLACLQELYSLATTFDELANKRHVQLKRCKVRGSPFSRGSQLTRAS